MKKLLSLILALVFAFTLCACGVEDTESASSSTAGKLPAVPPMKPAYVEVGENGSRTDDAVGFQLDLPKLNEKIAVLETNQGTIYMRLFPESAPIAVANFVGLVEAGYYNGLTFHRIMDNFMMQGGDPDGNGTGGTSVWNGKFEDEFNANLLNIRGSVAMANSGRNTNGSQFFINQCSTPVKKLEHNFSYTYNNYKSQYGDVLKQEYASLVSQYGEEVTSLYPTADDYVRESIRAVIAKNGFLSDIVSDEAWDIYGKVGGNIHLDGAFKEGYGGHTVFAQVFKGMSIVDKICKVEVDSNDKPLEDVIIKKAYTTTVTEEILANADPVEYKASTGSEVVAP